MGVSEGTETHEVKLSHLLSWLHEFFSNLGVKSETKSEGLSGYIEFSNCHWLNNGNIDPISCLICRTMVNRSFSWIELKGKVAHSTSIATGAKACRFDITLSQKNNLETSSE